MWGLAPSKTTCEAQQWLLRVCRYVRLPRAGPKLMGVRSSEGLLLSRVLQEPLWRVSSIGCMVLPRLWRVKEVVLMSTGSARWKEGKKTDARQCFHLQKKFHQISASSSHAPKLVNKSPSWVTQTLLKLLPLCWNSEWVSLCVSPSREESQFPTAPQFTHWFSKPDIMQVCLPVLSVGSPIWSLDPLLLRGTSGCDKPLTSHCHGAVDSDLITFLPLPPFLMCPFLYIFHSRKYVLLVLSSFWR